MSASARARSKVAPDPAGATKGRPGRGAEISTERVGTLASSGERQATVHETKTHLSRLLAEVEAGATILITRRGKPVATLQAVRVRGPRVPGSMKGLISFDDSFFDPLPDDELELWGEA